MKQPLRKIYPRVRQTVKAGNTYYIVDLRRKNYTGPKMKWIQNREEALKYASAIGDKVAKSGLDSISVIGVDPRIVAWTEQFAINNKTLEQGINVDSARPIFTGCSSPPKRITKTKTPPVFAGFPRMAARFYGATCNRKYKLPQSRHHRPFIIQSVAFSFQASGAGGYCPGST